MDVQYNSNSINQGSQTQIAPGARSRLKK